MLHLTIQSRNSDEVVLSVHGWLMGENVALLKQEGEKWFQDGLHLVLDLSPLRFIDADGLHLLREWAGERLELRGGSLFIRGQIEQADPL